MIQGLYKEHPILYKHLQAMEASLIHERMANVSIPDANTTALQMAWWDGYYGGAMEILYNFKQLVSPE